MDSFAGGSLADGWLATSSDGDEPQTAGSSARSQCRSLQNAYLKGTSAAPHLPLSDTAMLSGECRAVLSSDIKDSVSSDCVRASIKTLLPSACEEACSLIKAVTPTCTPKVGAQQPAEAASDTHTAHRRLPAVHQARHVNVLVVGERSLGKTTWIENVRTIYGGTMARTSSPMSDSDSEYSTESQDDMALFLKQPSMMMTHIMIEDPDSHTSHSIRIQDTPGYTQSSCTKHIPAYIRRHLRYYFEVEQDPERCVPMSQLPDNRVDVCLFFLSSSTPKACDAALMEEVGALVPIVPIIAKADALDESELHIARRKIAATINMIEHNAHLEIMHCFPEADAAEAGAPSPQVFAVIGGNLMQETNGSPWPVRKYAWGQCEPLAPGHSDVAALNRLLMEMSIEPMKAATEARYLELRRRRLRSERRREQQKVEAEMFSLEAQQQEHERLLAEQLMKAHDSHLLDMLQHEQMLTRKLQECTAILAKTKQCKLRIW